MLQKGSSIMNFDKCIIIVNFKPIQDKSGERSKKVLQSHCLYCVFYPVLTIRFTLVKILSVEEY